MAKYVVLNFEDRIDDTAIGAADSTIKGLKARYEKRRAPRGIKKLFLAKHHVIEHRCVEPDAPLRFTDDPARIAAMRSDCQSSEKIYLVMHGDPRATDTCFTNAVPSTAGVLALANAKQLSAYLARLLPPRKARYRLALVMCYGARCKAYLSAEVNHQGMIPQQHLVTSFAYRLFQPLVTNHAVNASLSAVTGKIAHDSSTGGAMVEVEEMIDLNMEFSDVNREKLASMRAAVGGELLPQNEQSAAYKQRMADWQQSAEGKAKLGAFGDVMARRKQASAALTGPKASGSMHKYGKIEYRLVPAGIRIASKYGDSTGGLAAGTVLYEGPILAPVY